MRPHLENEQEAIETKKINLFLLTNISRRINGKHLPKMNLGNDAITFLGNHKT